MHLKSEIESLSRFHCFIDVDKFICYLVGAKVFSDLNTTDSLNESWQMRLAKVLTLT